VNVVRHDDEPWTTHLRQSGPIDGNGRGRRGSPPSRHGRARGRLRVACGHSPRQSWLWSLTAREVLDGEAGGIDQACSGDPAQEDDVHRTRGAARLRISAVLMRRSSGAEDLPRPAGACQIRLESSRQVQRSWVCLSRDERALRFIRRALTPSDEAGAPQRSSGAYDHSFWKLLLGSRASGRGRMGAFDLDSRQPFEPARQVPVPTPK
jgi:hypothetical protein